MRLWLNHSDGRIKPGLWQFRGVTDLKRGVVVALTNDLPQYDLYRGQVGTVVKILAPQVFEVEFSDDESQNYAMQALKAEQLMDLHYNQFIKPA